MSSGGSVVTVHIDLWSDFACPWCALGVYRLDVARSQFEHGEEITVTHRSFELDPRAPARRNQTMEGVLATKYGMSPTQVQAGHDRLTAFGREVGMDFDFAAIQLGSTFDAHRVAQAARGTEAEEAVVKGLFAAYFTDGQLVSDHGVLLKVATAAGMDAASVEQVLECDAFTGEVRADEQAAAEMGVTGVPHFVINGKWAIPGAQDVETMVLVLRRAWERTEVNAS
jgi:predicted DsbA family dithiol-disulfide isomerase